MEWGSVKLLIHRTRQVGSERKSELDECWLWNCVRPTWKEQCWGLMAHCLGVSRKGWEPQNILEGNCNKWLWDSVYPGTLYTILRKMNRGNDMSTKRDLRKKNILTSRARFPHLTRWRLMVVWLLHKMLRNVCFAVFVWTLLKLGADWVLEISVFCGGTREFWGEIVMTWLGWRRGGYTWVERDAALYKSSTFYKKQHPLPPQTKRTTNLMVPRQYYHLDWQSTVQS